MNTNNKNMLKPLDGLSKRQLGIIVSGLRNMEDQIKEEGEDLFYLYDSSILVGLEEVRELIDIINMIQRKGGVG